MSEPTDEQKSFAAYVWQLTSLDKLPEAYAAVVARDEAQGQKKDALIATLVAAGNALADYMAPGPVPAEQPTERDYLLADWGQATDRAMPESSGIIQIVSLLGREKLRADKAERELAEFRASEHLLHERYMRIRRLVGAFDTNHAGENRFEVTEAKVAELLKDKALGDHCRAFIAKQEITCAECVHQTDRVIENAYEFIEGVCNLAGYHATPKENF